MNFLLLLYSSLVHLHQYHGMQQVYMLLDQHIHISVVVLFAFFLCLLPTDNLVLDSVFEIMVEYHYTLHDLHCFDMNFHLPQMFLN